MSIDRDELEKKFKEEVENYNEQHKNINGVSTEQIAEMYVKVGRIQMLAEILGYKIDGPQLFGEVVI